MYLLKYRIANFYKSHSGNWLGIALILILGMAVSISIDMLSQSPTQWAIFLILGLIYLIVLSVSRDPQFILLLSLALSTLLNIDFALVSTAGLGQKSPRGINLSSQDILLAFLYYLWIKDLLKKKGEYILHSRFVPFVTFSLFVLWSMASSIVNLETLDKYTFFRLVYYLKQISLFWYLINNIRKPKHIKALLIGAFFGISIHMMAIIMEKSLGHAVNIPVISKKKESNLYKRQGRVKGFVNHPNNLARILSLYLPVILFTGLFYTKGKGLRIVLLITSFLAMLSVSLTLSRSGWIGTFISISIGLFIYAIRCKKVGAVLFIYLTVLTFTLPPILFTDNFISDRIIRANLTYKGPVYGRIPMFHVALNMIRENPSFGVGVGRYVTRMRSYDNSISMTTKRPVAVHNTLLYYAGENGIPAIIFLLTFFFYILYLGIKTYYIHGPPLDIITLGLTMGIFSSLIAINYTIYSLEEMPSLWIPMAIVSAVYLNFKPSKKSSQND